MNARTDEDRTALHWAVILGNFEIVEVHKKLSGTALRSPTKVLLEADANTDAVDDSGRTPLHHAAARGALDILEARKLSFFTSTEISC